MNRIEIITGKIPTSPHSFPLDSLPGVLFLYAIKLIVPCILLLCNPKSLPALYAKLADAAAGVADSNECIMQSSWVSVDRE